MARLIIRKMGYPDKSTTISAPLVTIGRTKENDIIFRGDSKVSRKHAKVEFSKGVFTVEDLDSANGTQVNDRLIRRRTQLKDGDKIVIGATEVVFFSEGGIMSAGSQGEADVQPYVPSPEEVAKHRARVASAQPSPSAAPAKAPQKPAVPVPQAQSETSACPKCGSVIDTTSIPKGAKVGCAKCKSIFTV
jgi:pSer/pThr/pTyr-binding forkhead associated (FHA) protein